MAQRRHRPRRRQARESAMQALYQLDQNPEVTTDDLRQFITERLHDDEMERFAWQLVQGFRNNQDQIDQTLNDTSRDWRVGRMAVVDRSVLRLAVFELLFADDAPPAVAINEPLEICKKFSTERSVRFVNGILDTISRNHTPTAPDETTD